MQRVGIMNEFWHRRWCVENYGFIKMIFKLQLLGTRDLIVRLHCHCHLTQTALKKKRSSSFESLILLHLIL